MTENRFTLAEIQNCPVIEQGHTDNLILATPYCKVWVSRLTKEDGMPYDNEVTLEAFNSHDGFWFTVDTYEPV